MRHLNFISLPLLLTLLFACTPTEPVTQAEPQTSTATANRYDGWDIGVSIEIPDATPLRSIITDNDGLFVRLGTQSADSLFSRHHLAQDDLFIGVWADKLFAWPSVSPMEGDQFVERAMMDVPFFSLGQTEFVEMTRPTQSITAGNGAFTTAIANVLIDGEPYEMHFAIGVSA